MESYLIEALFDKEQNTLMNVFYRSQEAVTEPFEKHFYKKFSRKKEGLKSFPYC